MQAGETLYDIASQYGITTRQLKEANIQDLDAAGKSDIRTVHRVIYKSDIIYPGQELKLPSTDEDAEDTTPAAAPSAAPVAQAPMPVSDAAGAADAPASTPQAAEGADARQGAIATKTVETPDLLKVAITAAASTAAALSSDSELSLAPWEGETMMSMDSEPASAALTGLLQEATAVLTAHEPHNPHQTAALAASTAGAGVGESGAAAPQAPPMAALAAPAVTDTVELPQTLRPQAPVAEVTDTVEIPEALLPQAPAVVVTRTVEIPEALQPQPVVVRTVELPDALLPQPPVAVVTRTVEIPEALLPQPAVMDTVEIPEAMLPQPLVAPITDTIEIPEALQVSAPAVQAPAAVDLTQTIEIPQAFQVGGSAVQGSAQPAAADVTQTVDIPQAFQVGGDPAPQEAQSPPAATHTIEIPKTFHMKAAAIPQTAAASALPDMAARTVSEGATEQAAAAITVGDLKTKPAAQQSFISSLVNTVTEQQQVHQKIERLIKALEGDAPAQEAMNTGGEAGAVWNNIQPLPSSRPGAYPFSTNTQPELVSGGGFGSSSLPQGGGGTAVLSAPAATAVAVELPRSFVAAPPAPARSGESVAASPVAEVVLEVKAGAEPATSSDLVAKPSEPVMEVLAPEQAAPTQPAPAHVFSPELLLEPVAALPAAASAPGAAEVGESTASAGSTTTYDAAPAAADPMAIAVSKAQLLDSVYGTGRGLDAPVDVRAKVEKLLHELEGLKPRLRPAKALELLAGRWKMVYTSSAQVLMLMNAIRQIPLIAIGDISQAIDSETAMVHNKVDIAVPFMMSLSTQAGLEVRTTRQFKVKFQLAGVNTQILTPKLLDNLEVPDSLSLLGQKIDLSPLRDALSPMNVALQRMRSVTTSALAPDLPAVEGSTPPDVHAWLETTYLDDNLRVCRDEAGGVFVLVKDVSLH
ncbi:hypothetical protein WJX72_005075 [[Myrmecia] bisecta]|uniref:LysM domain-containing protein n=1 Tax=[Myrmecia] bisecta TaxID=41462 RepID=A0AAW1PPF9_9CHLO